MDVTFLQNMANYAMRHNTLIAFEEMSTFTIEEEEKNIDFKEWDTKYIYGDFFLFAKVFVDRNIRYICWRR